MGDKELKVTDKRMFTADGELREEYRHLDRESASVAEPAAEATTPEAGPEPAAAAQPAGESPGAASAAAAGPEPEAAAAPSPEAFQEPPGPAAPSAADETSDEAPRLEIPGTGLGEPTFLDLVTLLAEPIALYLGDAQLPDGESAENLDMARLHIDLLEVLRRKTAGNLGVEESRLLEDLLYRCRLRYVQKRG